MKTYPSIPNCSGQKHFNIQAAHIFDKIDGNNLRFEYSKKQGWHKFGSRTQLIDETSEQFEGSIPWFFDNLADDIFKLNPKAQHIITFCEWAGEKSFCGMHDPEDKTKQLYLFDICIDKRGFVTPAQFVKTYVDKVNTPAFLGIYNFTRGFVDLVAEGNIEGITFEGVVAKSIKGKSQLIMGKAKTQAWKQKVKQTFQQKDADRILLS